MTEKEIENIIANPNYDIWIEANAGSGKTTTLIKRFINLLISDVPIDAILCITFTKVAANELMIRISKIINYLSTLDEENLIEELKKYNDNIFFDLNQIKSKFSIIQSKQLQIMTIDSLAFELLNKITNYQQEFNIFEPSHWQVVEAREYAFQETCSILLEKITNNNYKIDKKYRSFLNNFRGDRLNDFLHNLANNIYLAVKCDTENLIKSIKNNNSKDINCLLSNVSNYRLLDIINIFDQCDNKTSKKSQYQLKEIMELINTNQLQDKKNIILDKLVDLVLTNSSNGYNLKKKLLSASLQKLHPELNDIFFQLANLVYEVKINQIIDELISDVEIFDSIVVDYYFNYNFYKKQNNIYEFLDIIQLIIDKLRDPGNVNFLKDFSNKIRHFMLDEAQDTGAIAWQLIDVIIQNIIENKNEYNSRSIFIVGDPKQAIYSFQGADFNTFLNKKKEISKMLVNYGYSLKEISLLKSYRSSNQILQLVDNIFNQQEVLEKFSEKNKIQHICTKNEIGKFDNIELQQPINAKSDDLDWFDRYLTEPERDNKNLDILEKIKDLIASLKDNGYHEKDIMILAYSRKVGNQLLVKIPKYLEEYGICSNQIDRFDINEALFYQDIISILKFIWLPNDDLNLFSLLLTPLFNFNRNQLEENIYLIKQNQSDLFNFIEQNYLDVYNKLQNIRRIYFSKNDNVNSLIYQILDSLSFYEIYCRNNLATMDSINFCCEIISNMISKNLLLPDIIKKFGNTVYKITNKRDPNKLYVGTVHSVKGAESEVVILLDLQTKASKDANQIMFNDDYNNLFFIPKLAKYYHNIKEINELHQREQLAIEKEKLRMLYVAITRAKKEFYMIGYPNSLHFQLVRSGMNLVNSESI